MGVGGTVGVGVAVGQTPGHGVCVAVAVGVKVSVGVAVGGNPMVKPVPVAPTGMSMPSGSASAFERNVNVPLPARDALNEIVARVPLPLAPGRGISDVPLLVAHPNVTKFDDPCTGGQVMLRPELVSSGPAAALRKSRRPPLTPVI